MGPWEKTFVAIEDESDTTRPAFRLGRATMALASAGVLIVGASAMLLLLRLGTAPAEALIPRVELALPVEAIIVEPIDLPVTIIGQGHAIAWRRVMVAPEVSGRVIATHAALVEGGVIRKGESIFTIDKKQYGLAVREAAAQVAERETVVRRLQTELRNDEQRLDPTARKLALAETQYERLKTLLEEDVGTQEAIENAEQAYVNASDEMNQLENRVALYPIRLEESRNALETARARLESALTELQKTEVVVPFTARVNNYAIENGQFVPAGQKVAELVDDSVLEIHVPLDSREAQRWLPFAKTVGDVASDSAWFSDVQPVDCEVTWVEDLTNHGRTGRLARVASYDEGARTVSVVVKVTGRDASFTGAAGLPLVEGMYCKVSIPGKTLEDVFAVPEFAVSIDETVNCAVDGRLETRPVVVARRNDGVAYISDGLSPSDVVVTTRLVDPLERTLLHVSIVSSPETDQTNNSAGASP